MQAKGPMFERETTITINAKDNIAIVNTSDQRMYRILLRKGYKPIKDSERSAWFRIPKKCIKLRAPATPSKKQLDTLAKARAKANKKQEEKRLKPQKEYGQDGVCMNALREQLTDPE